MAGTGNMIGSAITPNFRGDVNYFSSPEYQAFQKSGMTEEGMPRSETADRAYSSPYFGAGLSSSSGARQDQAYQDYLNRTQVAPQRRPSSMTPAPDVFPTGTAGGAFADLSGTMTQAQIDAINRQSEMNQNAIANRIPNTVPTNFVAPNPINFLPSTPISPGEPAANASQIDASIRPFLTEGLKQAQEIFLRQQPQMFQGQTYVSPSQQTLAALQQQENIASSSSMPILGQAQSSFLRGLTEQSAASPLYQNIYGAAGFQPGVDVYSQVAGGGMVNPATGMAQNLYGQAGTQPGASAYQQAAQGGMQVAGQQQLQNLYGQSGQVGSPSIYGEVAGGQIPVAGQSQLQGLYGQAGAQPGQQVFGQAAGGQFGNMATGQLANIAGGGFLNANPYQQQMMQAATRPLEQQFAQSVLPGISSLYSKSGRLGSGSMERALGTATESFGRALGDVTSNLAGSQFQQERQLQQQALGQLAGVSAQDIQTRLAGAGALEQAQRAATSQQAGIAGQLAGLSQQDIANRLAAAGSLEASQRAGIGQQAGLAGQLAGLSAQDIQTRLAGAGGLQASQAQGIAQQSGLLGQIGGFTQQDIANRLAGATGLQGAQQAALGTQLQAASGVGATQATDLSRQLQASLAAPQIYGQQFLPSQQLAQVGGAREAIASQPLQEQMARFAFTQRLPYEQLSGYLSSVYGSPLGSFGTPAQQPQYTNNTVGALGGALGGGIGGYALGSMLPSSFLGGYGGAAGGALGALAGGLLGGGVF